MLLHISPEISNAWVKLEILSQDVRNQFALMVWLDLAWMTINKMHEIHSEPVACYAAHTKCYTEFKQQFEKST